MKRAAKTEKTKKDEIKITQNDKGGLTFDVPEGTTVSISDPAKDKKKKDKSSKGGFTKFLILILVAVIAFTGFVKPGFFLKKKKPSENWYVPTGGNSGNTANNTTNNYQELPEYSGNSKPFEVSPLDGITVRAEENAFNKDTTVSFTVLDDLPDQYAQLEKELEDEWLLPVCAWEVDAGLADDEVIPGVFEVEIDLEKLDIDPAYYPCLSVARVGDDGSFYEYAVSINDNKLTYQSRQNSATLLLIGGVVIVYRGAQAFDYVNESKYFWSRKDYLKRFVEVKKYQTPYGSYEMQWITKDIDPSVSDKIDRIHEIEDQCTKEAKEYGDTLEYTKKLDKNKQMMDYYKYLLESNEEYKTLKEQIKIPEAISETKKLIDIAYQYLAKEAHVRMPSGKVIYLARTDSNAPENKDKLGLAEKLNFSTIVSLWPVKGLREDRDNFLLTITHETFHVCQERYRLSPPVAGLLTDDQRYDEMVTMVLERDARQHYMNQGIMTSEPPLTDKLGWDTLRLPIDKEPSSDGTADKKTLKMKEGYQLGDFVMYLQEQYKDHYVSPHQLMKARSYISQAGVSEPLMKAFGILKEDEFDLYFRKWLISCRGRITEISTQCFNEGSYFPKNWIKVKKGESYHIPLEKDGSYLLSLRGFQKGDLGAVKGFLLFDDDFRKNHPSINLVPLTNGYVNIKNGAYFDDISFLIIGEIYGQIDSGENMDVGYTMWIFQKTPSVTLSEQEETLSVQLPKTDGAAKAGVIEGYVLKICEGSKVLVEDTITKDKFEQAVSYAKSDLYKGKDLNEQLEVTVTICEYVADNDGKKYLGVESDPVTITLGKENKNEKVYSNLYLYKDRLSEFDGDVIDSIAGKSNYTVGAWPKNNEVKINGKQVQVTLGALDWSASGYDEQDSNIKSGLQCIRDSVTLIGEYSGDYGDDFIYYKITQVIPSTIRAAAIESGTERETTYASGETKYVYIDYKTTHDVTYTSIGSDSSIDLHFKNGDISSVDINLYGKYSYKDTYWDEENGERISTNEREFSQKIQLLK
ncbi:MAG: hypothetical protein IK151_08590 [Erysipelotrichaceae bacterium]|nr:hypothetical protein [Erysipelotrichaceae bacterium]